MLRTASNSLAHVLKATIHGSRKRMRDRPTSTTTFPNRLAAPKENRGRPRHAPTNRVLPDTARRRHQHTISHSTEEAKRPAPFPTNGVSGHAGAVHGVISRPVELRRCRLSHVVSSPAFLKPVSFFQEPRLSMFRRTQGAHVQVVFHEGGTASRDRLTTRLRGWPDNYAYVF